MQQKIIIGLALTLIIVIFIPLYWATESGRQEAARERLKDEAIERGAELYISQCAACHGPAGEGKIGPALKGSPLDDNVLEKIIVRGIAGTAMPAMGNEDGGPLKEHQIKDLVAFIRNWDQSLIESSSTPTTEPAPAPIPPPTASAIITGELYAGNCAACHGVKRQGVSGFSPALTPESLAALSYTEIRDAILNGRSNTSMPPFKGTLNQEEIDALVQFLKDTSP